MTTATITIELKVDVTGNVTRYRRATQYDPEEGGTVEDIEATLDGHPITLTKADLELAEEALLEQAREDAAEDRAAMGDWERDRILEGRMG